MLDFRNDGTITATLEVYGEPGEDGARAVVGTATITLRRPTLDELFGLWQTLDDGPAGMRRALGDQAAPEPEPAPEGEAEATPDDEGDPGDAAAMPSRRSSIARNLDAMRFNLWWQNQAFALLGDRPLTDFVQPAWLVNGRLPSQMLLHWQTIPLAPGNP